MVSTASINCRIDDVGNEANAHVPAWYPTGQLILLLDLAGY
jgi:hypothetical protein